MILVAASKLNLPMLVGWPCHISCGGPGPIAAPKAIDKDFIENLIKLLISEHFPDFALYGRWEALV